jgi:ankyrin repeat protein
MEQGYMAQIAKLIEEKLNSKTPQERLEMLNDELSKQNPDMSLIENLLQKGVGKKMTMDSIKKSIVKAKVEKEKKVKTEIEERKKREEATPLLIAEFQKSNPSYEVVKELLECGADPNVEFRFEKYKFDEEGWSPLHVSAWKNLTEHTKLLIEKGADIHKFSDNGNHGTPLHWTCDCRLRRRGTSIEVAKILLEAGADPTLNNNDSCSACDWANNNDYDNMLDLFRKYMK